MTLPASTKNALTVALADRAAADTLITILDASGIATTGNQTITGNKTFSGSSVFSGSLTASAAATFSSTTTLAGATAHTGTTLGLFGKTPVAQPATIAHAAVDAASAIAKVNLVIDALIALGAIAAS